MAIIDNINLDHISILPNYSHDDNSRNLFIGSLSQHLKKNIYSEFYKKYQNQLPNTINDKKQLSSIRNFLLKKNTYRFWSSLKRTSQEILFDNVGISIHNQIDKFSYDFENQKLNIGKINLSKNINPPKYITSVDIHCMPGGYINEYSKNDISTGTTYDA